MLIQKRSLKIFLFWGKIKSKSEKSDLLLVLKTGIEPVRYRYRRILSPVRLPVPPLKLNMVAEIGLEPTTPRV